MDSHTWERLESVFFAALEVAPAERASYLDLVCGGDTELRTEVSAVLAAHISGGGADSLTRDGDESVVAGSVVGTRIGAYRLVELVGRGGMGEVYRAERVDEQYQQEVAVKLVRSGLDAADMIRRFRVERQILAHLQHPNIAALLDGGVTQDGQPYLVMQYVHGVPIAAYAEAHGLTVVERLRLFRTVCAAVQYAHANLVVHRDLKPSNILVTEEGQVRLLDFGIAKLLDAGDTDAAPIGGLTGDMLLLTPEHAAPEQLRRQPITTATDVYALGVLLYELLTGERPFRATSPIELYQAVLDEEPTAPSAAVVARFTGNGDGRTEGPATSAPDRTRIAHARELRGDLDHIVLMALRKEAERRYVSAGQFGDDVTHFLEGRPVLARPDTVGYRLRRFIGRNRTAVSLSAIAAASLVAGLVGTASQAQRARSEAAQAAVDRDRAERVSGLLVDMFRLSDPSATRGRTVTAREVLNEGATRIAKDLADQPEPQADLLTEVGKIYENLGLFDDASVHLERALELRQSIHGDNHPLVAESLTRLAHLRTEQQQSEAAVGFARSATAILRRREETRASRSALADALLALGGALRVAATPVEATSAYAEALELLEESAGPDDPRFAQAFFGWADAAHSQGQFDLADSLLHVTTARHARLGNPPDPDAAASLNNLGMLRMFRRRPAEAEPLLRQALDMRRRIYGEVHPAVSETLSGLAQALSLLGRFEEAADVGTSAVAVADSAWGADNVNSAGTRVALGFILMNVNQGERAVQVLNEARTVFLAQPGQNDPRAVGSEITIAQAYNSMGAFERARTAFTEALRNSDTMLGTEHPYRAHILLELARLDFDDSRLGDAEARARQSIALTEKVLRPGHRFALWATVVLAQTQAARGDLAAADTLLRRVLAEQRATVGENNPETAVTLVQLADVEIRLGLADQAEEHVRLAMSIFESNGLRGTALTEARSVLGGALAASGHRTEAEPLLREAVRDLGRMRGARASQVAAAETRLAAFVRK